MEEGQVDRTTDRLRENRRFRAIVMKELHRKHDPRHDTRFCESLATVALQGEIKTLSPMGSRLGENYERKWVWKREFQS